MAAPLVLVTQISAAPAEQAQLRDVTRAAFERAGVFQLRGPAEAPATVGVAVSRLKGAGYAISVELPAGTGASRLGWSCSACDVDALSRQLDAVALEVVDRVAPRPPPPPRPWRLGLGLPLSLLGLGLLPLGAVALATSGACADAGEPCGARLNGLHPGGAALGVSAALIVSGAGLLIWDLWDRRASRPRRR